MKTLTTAQARALRSADAVCFDHNGDDFGIRAIHRGPDHSHEVTTRIPVEQSRVTTYDGSSGPVSAFEMVMSAKYDAVWQTIAYRVKAGTRIGLVWHRGNASPVLDAAGLVCDMLDVQIQNGNVCDTFRLSTRVGLDNSARMVRR